LPRPPSSAFRVWLPSARLTPSESVSVLFHTDSALGIHPSELTPLARYQSVSALMNPPTVFPALATVAGATGRPGKPRFLGFHPCESPWRSVRRIRASNRWMLPWVFPLPGFAAETLSGPSPASLSRAFPGHPKTLRRRLRVSIDFRLARSPATASRRKRVRATLVGFLHQHAPAHLSEKAPGLLIHHPPRRVLLPTDRRFLGARLARPESHGTG
jgi:hypothetical protein